MRKFFVCMVLIMPILFCGCVRETGEGSLEVRCSTWSGWTEAYEPEISTYTYNVSSGSEITIDQPRSLSFTVLSVSEEMIHLQFSEGLCIRSENGTADFTSTQTEFVVPIGETVTLVTPTTDAGCVYEFCYGASAD